MHIIRSTGMLTLRSRLAWVVVLIAGLGAATGAQQVKADSAAAARAFVESFYRWYVPIAVADHKEAADAIALRERPHLFSPQLYRALKADNDVQAKTPGELVGLDADPFLNNQDPCDGFAIGRVEHRRAVYRVEVFSVCNGKRLPGPSALADVRPINGHWVFVDFFHAGGTDGLLATLRRFAEERRKSGYPPSAALPNGTLQLTKGSLLNCCGSAATLI